MSNVLHLSTRYGRDLAMAAAGILLIGNAAPSIRDFGGGPVFAIAWASFIAIGSTVSIISSVLKRTGTEVIAQLWVCVGFIVWAGSAVMQPGRNGVSWAISLVFTSIAVSCVYRVEMIADRRVDR